MKIFICEDDPKQRENMVTIIKNYRFFIFYGGKVKLPAFFNTQKAQLPL
ncbi:accessory gene regulator protein A [Staphylococcus aureus]|nr:accessory gene regulator protein A [Staphylococcus aureus]